MEHPRHDRNRNGQGQPGYIEFCGTIQPGETITDHALRGQALKAICRAEGCYRRLNLDPVHLRRCGLGALTARKVQALFHCHRIDRSCGLDWLLERPAFPLALAPFMGLQHVRLRLACGTDRCPSQKVFRVEEVVAGLKARGQGDEGTTVDLVGSMMTTACPTCGKAAWSASLICADRNSLGWHQRGERVFDNQHPSAGHGAS